MLAFVIRRLLIMIPTLISISVIVFVIIQLPRADTRELRRELHAQGGPSILRRSRFLRESYGSISRCGSIPALGLRIFVGDFATRSRHLPSRSIGDRIYAVGSRSSPAVHVFDRVSDRSPLRAPYSWGYYG